MCGESSLAVGKSNKIDENTMKAIAKETYVNKPYSKQFISKYNLGSISSVRTIIKTLSEKGVLINHNGVHLSDWYFSQWLKTQL